MSKHGARRKPEHYELYPITRNSVNKTAALVTGRAPKHSLYEAPVPKDTDWYAVCPPLRPFHQAAISDLTGKKAGNLTVIGLLKEPYHNVVRWVVRCTCGGYEYRTRKALLKVHNQHRCSKCQHVADASYKYERAKFRQVHGYWPNDRLKPS